MIRWRLKWRGIKDITYALSSAFRHEPGKTITLLASIPMKWLHHKLEHGGEEENSEWQATNENIIRNEYHTLNERLDLLPQELQNFSKYFGKPRFSQGELSEMFSYSEAEEIIKLCPHMRALSAYGISLEDFYGSMRGIPMFLGRLYHRRMINDNSRITLDRELKCTALSNIDPEIDIARMKCSIEFEIGMGCNEGSPIGNGMWRWIYDVLAVRPYFFEGYEALREGTSLVLIKSNHIPETRYDTEPGESERLDKLRWETVRA